MTSRAVDNCGTTFWVSYATRVELDAVFGVGGIVGLEYWLDRDDSYERRVEGVSGEQSRRAGEVVSTMTVDFSEGHGELRVGFVMGERGVCELASLSRRLRYVVGATSSS